MFSWKTGWFKNRLYQAVMHTYNDETWPRYTLPKEDPKNIWGWWSWFKFNNLGLTQGTNLKFYTSVVKGLKLKVKKFWGQIPTFVEVTGEKLVGGGLSWIGLKSCSVTFFSNEINFLNFSMPTFEQHLFLFRAISSIFVNWWMK